MNAGLRRAVCAIALLLFGSVSALAQQAIITGIVTDSSGGVLPGVTVTVIHDATRAAASFRTARATRRRTWTGSRLRRTTTRHLTANSPRSAAMRLPNSRWSPTALTRRRGALQAWW